MTEAKGAHLEKIPINFQLGDKLIDGATIRSFRFQEFVNYITEAAGMKEPESFDSRWRRMRLAKQVTYHMNGAVVPIGILDVTRLPLRDSQAILARLSLADEGKPGRIVRDGDGIDKALVYELGTPVQIGAGKEPIRELEFLAQTYGDIEDVLGAANGYQQALQLIRHVGKPLGTSLQLLPDGALSQITVSDGAFVMNEIMPRFLGSPVE